MNSLFLEKILQLAASVDPALSATHPGRALLITITSDTLKLYYVTSHYYRLHACRERRGEDTLNWML